MVELIRNKDVARRVCRDISWIVEPSLGCRAIPVKAASLSCDTGDGCDISTKVDPSHQVISRMRFSYKHVSEQVQRQAEGIK